MTSGSTRYAIGDLAQLAGSTPRTVRYYVSQGLLPPPIGSGPGAHYTSDHLERLRLVQRLQRQHQPLSEIRQRLAQLGAREVAELLADEEPEAPSDSALEYVRTVLAGPVPAAARPTSSPAMSPASPREPVPPTPAALLASPAPRIQSSPRASGLLGRRSASPPAPSAPSAPSAATPSIGSLGDVSPAPELSGVADTPAELMSTNAAAPDVAAPEVAAPDVAAGSSPLEWDLQTPEQRSQWDRIGLTPNIEIHVRRPLSRLENRRVERLITIARHMLREEKP